MQLKFFEVHNESLLVDKNVLKIEKKISLKQFFFYKNMYLYEMEEI